MSQHRRSHFLSPRRFLPALLTLVLFGALAAAAQAKPPAADFWGLQTAGMLSNPPSAPEETTAMNQLGIHTVRMEIPWAEVQKSDGTCGGGPKSGVGGPESGINWTPLDNRILKAAQDGITVLANLGGRRYGSETCRGYQTKTPSEQEYNEWYKPGGFVTQLVQRYGVGGKFWNAGEPGAGQSAHAIKIWEVANEENFSVFAPVGGPDPWGYGKYLIDTAWAVKAVNPGATVLLGGLAPFPAAVNPETFIKQMYEAPTSLYTSAELDSSYNGVSYHPYSLTNNHGYTSPGGVIGDFQYGQHAGEVLKKVETFRNYLDTHGDADKTLWLTEVGFPVGTNLFEGGYTETPTQQAADLYETLHLLDLKADANKVQYVGWYLFQDRTCPGTGCGWDDLAGLRELNKTIRYSWCAYSHLTLSFACPYVPKGGFKTKTTISEPTTTNGTPGSVSFTGTVNVTNIPGEPVTGLTMNVNFYKENSKGEFPLQSTDHPLVTNGVYAETNRPVVPGNWKVKAVFPPQGNFNQSESGLHPFTIKPAGCATQTFVTPSNPVSSAPGFITINGQVQVVNPECGVVNGQYVNVNFYKQNGSGEYVYNSTDHPVVYNGAYSEINRPVGSGNWKVQTVFPSQDWFKESSSGLPPFSIGTNGWHIDNLGGTFTADPDISSQGPGKLDVFGRGAENGLWIKSFPVSGGWGGWVAMGGNLAGGPGAVSWSNNRIDVVMRDPGNNVSHFFWQGGWGSDYLGGGITSDPDISSWGTNRLDVFARGPGNELLHKYWAGAGWSGWENMGGNLAGGPGAVSWGVNRIDVVARMSDNTIGHWYWGGAGWAYDNLGGTLTSDPDIASQGAGKLDVFARGTDSGLWHRWYTTSYGQWSNWESMGGAITSGPGAVSWGAGRVDVVARAANNSLEHWWFQ